MDTNENNVSGLTQAAFCREWNINPKTLARWLKIEREDAEVSFCEVEVLPEASSGNGLRISLPNGVEVRLRTASLNDLGTVLREAAGCLD